MKKTDIAELHNKEMKALGSHACAVKSLYNILGKSPKEIASAIKFKKKKGAYILDCMMYLQRHGWLKYGVEECKLSGDEIFLYIMDCFGTEAGEFCVIISYDNHVASFHKGKMVELASGLHECVIYFLKKEG